ncbi:XisI protein [Chloroflexi bacterium TSY]|nr:XisI protein [Chloroflexi bacterium TSY]
MDTQLNYPEIVKKILKEYADLFSEGSKHPLRTVFDDVNQSYLLLASNWYGREYIHHTSIHIDIINDKIWIQYDDTEEGVATDLLGAGVPAHDIVLGFRPAELRQYTEFAVA